MSEYIPENWQNFGRPLTREELNEIRSKISGLHFAKEAVDPTAIQALYCAEALLREIDSEEDLIPRPIQRSSGQGIRCEHFGCPDCGRVWTLPSEPDDAPPYCASHGGEYSWRPDVEGRWTRCVRVRVRMNRSEA